MATVWRAPIDPPEFSDYIEGHRFADLQRDEDAYVEKLRGMAKQNGTSELLGEVVRWQRADGYAQYMVWQTRPLQLIHLDLGDGWEVEDALIRGLRLSDVEDMVAHSRRLREIFSR